MPSGHRASRTEGGRVDEQADRERPV